MQENDTPQPLPSPKPEGNKGTPVPDPVRETTGTAKLDGQSSSPLKARNPIKIAGIAVLVVLLLGLGGAVYFLQKERTRTQSVEAKLAQLESQILKDRQNNSVTTQSVESLRQEFRKFKEQTTEQFAAEERTLQALKNTGSFPIAPQQAVEHAPATKQELESGKPTETERAPEKKKEPQDTADFIAILIRNLIAIVREVSYKTLDFLSDLLKRPV